MFDRCIYFNVNVLSRTINTIWEEEFKKVGLSPAHAYILRYIVMMPGTNQRQIAEDLHLDKSTVTRFIDALVVKGLVKREQHRNDRRVFQTYATAEGKRLAAEVEAIADGLYASMQRKLGKTNFREFVNSVKQIARALEVDKP